MVMGTKILAAVETGDEPIPPEAFSYEEVKVIPENDGPKGQIDQQTLKINYWQNRLIDLSLRNNLLNYRLQTQGIPLDPSNLGRTEDILAMGERVFIQPRPSKWNHRAGILKASKMHYLHL